MRAAASLICVIGAPAAGLTLDGVRVQSRTWEVLWSRMRPTCEPMRQGAPLVMRSLW
jgi:hypothetical protein